MFACHGTYRWKSKAATPLNNNLSYMLVTIQVQILEYSLHVMITCKGPIIHECTQFNSS